MSEQKTSYIEFAGVFQGILSPPHRGRGSYQHSKAFHTVVKAERLHIIFHSGQKDCRSLDSLKFCSIEASVVVCLHDGVQGLDIGCSPQGKLPVLTCFPELFKGICHGPVQPVIHLELLPRELLQILNLHVSKDLLI